MRRYSISQAIHFVSYCEQRLYIGAGNGTLSPCMQMLRVVHILMHVLCRYSDVAYLFIVIVNVNSEGHVDVETDSVYVCTHCA